MNRVFSFCLLILFLVVLGCKDSPNKPSTANSNSKSSSKENDGQTDEVTDRVQEMMDSENQIESLALQISNLAKTLMDMEADRSEIFQDTIQFTGPAEVDFDELTSSLASENDHPVFHVVELKSSGKPLDLKQNHIWPQITSHHAFDSCQFGTVGGKFEGDKFLAETVFEGRFSNTGSNVVGVKASQTIEWSKTEFDTWLISGWVQKEMKLVVNRNSLFEDVTDQLITNADTLQELQKYSHWDLMVENANIDSARIRFTRAKFRHFNDWESSYQYPCVSVLDLNGDGFDDLFITDRWSPAKLLKNNGDKTFTDVTKESGLVVEELSTATFFADFDNDGDSDAFVGGSLGPSRYFKNEDGVFVEDKSLDFQMKDIRFVSSGSVADVNGDGLLDIYLSTYGLGTGNSSTWINSAVRPEDRAELQSRYAKSHFYLDRAGPPNILLLNRNGKLTRANNIDNVLAQWRNTYQSVWSDFDQDGDPDLYVCNDFSSDAFLRNDTEKGKFNPKFTDISKEIVTNGKMGFGMGASLGDYNNDGMIDLYISNMYSKAGSRILKKFPDVDERIKTASRGNFLYKNLGSQFEQVAGFGENEQHVSKVGWSFGGQFADFDNDGKLDIYVPSGFYSPPPEIQITGDS